MDKYLENNRSLWNGWTNINVKAPAYRTEEFKAGLSKLRQTEISEVGDVKGKTMLHLQCHFGLDTLSWARLGAIVTGVDFSERAIEEARNLSQELQIPALFVCSNVYDLPQKLDACFDIVFTSYGVLCWLPDLTKWAEVIAHFLKPGGRFHMVEFHPFTNPFDPFNPDGTMELMSPYFAHEQPLLWLEKGSYADREADFVHEAYEWSHSIADIINSLIGAGLRIEHFNEFPFCISECFPGRMVEDSEGWWRLKEHPDSLPLMFSIKAVKE